MTATRIVKAWAIVTKRGVIKAVAMQKWQAWHNFSDKYAAFYWQRFGYRCVRCDVALQQESGAGR